MSTFRNPVGPQSSNVYWRRRLIVGLGLLAVVTIILLIVFGPKASSDPAPTAPPTTSSATPGATSPAASNPSNAKACDPARVSVEAITDASSYAAGQNPQLSFSLKSTMTEPCVIDAGSDIQTFVITSGSDEIWNSTHCQTNGEAGSVVLQPGVPVQSSTIEWDRTRSATDTCESDRPVVTAGGASYHLEVTVGSLTSAATKQFLLN
ncbi:MAG: hypothetical protein ACOH1K_05865 [Rhodoglobus sp.]